MRLEVWYVSTKGVWEFFYDHYGHDFKWAVDDARKTLGIDQWAIVRGSTILASTIDAPAALLKAVLNGRAVTGKAP